MVKSNTNKASASAMEHTASLDPARGVSDKENMGRTATKAAAKTKLDAEAPIAKIASANRKFLAALSMSDSKANIAKASQARSEGGGARAKEAPPAGAKSLERAHAEGSSSPNNAAARKGAKKRGKELRLLLQPLPMVSPTPRLLMLDTNGGAQASRTSTPLRRDLQSPAAATPKDGGSAARSRPTPSALSVLGKIPLRPPSSKRHKNSSKQTTTTTMTTLKIVTQQAALTFPEALDAMICEAAARNSKALYWACDGQSFGIDLTKKEELGPLLTTYFNHANYTSLQRQLNIYGWKKNKDGQFKGTFYNPLFHRDKCRSVELSPIRRSTSISPKQPSSSKKSRSPKRGSSKKSPKRNSTASPNSAGLSNSTPRKLATVKAPSESGSTGRRIRIKISAKDTIAPLPVPDPTTFEAKVKRSRGRSPSREEITAAPKKAKKVAPKKAKRAPGKSSQGRGKPSVRFDDTVKTNTNTQAVRVNQRTVTPALTATASPPREDDLQRAALSMYNGESLDSLGKSVGNDLFGEHGSGMATPKPSLAQFAPVSGTAPFQETYFQAPSAQNLICQTPYADQYNHQNQHYHPTPSTQTWKVIPAAAEFASDGHLMQSYFVPPLTEINSWTTTVDQGHYGQDGRSASSCTPVKMQPLETGLTNHRHHRRPSAEDFAMVLGDVSTLESPEEDTVKPQPMSSFFNREKEIIDEIDHAQKETPNSARLTMTLFDTEGKPDAKAPTEMVSPIDPSAIKQGRFTGESFFYGEAPVADSHCHEDSLLAKSPMETTAVCQRRPRLSMESMGGNSHHPIQFALPMSSSSYYPQQHYHQHSDHEQNMPDHQIQQGSHCATSSLQQQQQQQQQYSVHPPSAFHQHPKSDSQQPSQHKATIGAWAPLQPAFDPFMMFPVAPSGFASSTTGIRLRILGENVANAQAGGALSNLGRVAAP